MRDISGLVQKATGQHGLLTTRQLRRLGCSESAQRRLIANGVLAPVRRGVVRLSGAPVTWEQQLCALVLSTCGRGVASHRSALRLHGLRNRFSGLEITVPLPGNAVAGAAIVHRSRTLDAASVTVVNGLRTTTPERTVIDVAPLFPDRELTRIVDHAVATRVFEIGDLVRVRSKMGRGVPGLVRLDRVLALADVGRRAESGPERALVRLLLDAGLPRPVEQHLVAVFGCRYRIDLAYPAAQVAIEYDGFAAHSGHRSFENDRQRQNHLVQAGWTVLRFTARDLRERSSEVISLVRSALDRPALDRPALDRFRAEKPSLGDANSSQNG